MKRFTHYRLDLVIEETGRDPETGTVEFRVTPNPVRYEWRTRDGVRWLYDKMDNVWISREMFEDGVSRAGTPIYYDPPAISDAEAYAKERMQPFGELLACRDQLTAFSDVSEDFLRSLPDGEGEFVIMSLDIVGSTTLAAQSNAPTYARSIAAITTELSRVIPLFRGHILKYTGDGFIAYFATPNFIGKHDLALDCASALARVVRTAINPALAGAALPKIEFRIGLDSGSASVETLGDLSTKRQRDLIGFVVSLACKIQSRAPVGGIALGDEVLRSLHTHWRERCEPLPTPDWNYQRDGKPYPLYTFRLGSPGRPEALSPDEESGPAQGSVSGESDPAP